MATRIFMTGEAGYHNLGDEAMALASAGRLRHYFPDAEIVATGFDPLGAVLRHQARIVPWPLTYYDLHSSFARRLIRKYVQKLGASEDFLDPVGKGLNTIFEEQHRQNARFRSVLNEIEQADFVFDMGHGALNDVFDPFMLYFLYYLCSRLHKPLFISGQSIGPLSRRRTIQMLRDTLACAHTVGLRDKDVSHKLLVDQVGVDTQRVHLVEVGDDTLDLEPQEPNWSNFSPDMAQLIQAGNFFAVEWRGTDYTQAMELTEHLVPLAKAITHIHELTGLTPVFVPLAWELTGGDIMAAARLYDLTQGQVPLQVVWNYLRAPEVKWLLKRARFGIGLSYHFHVFLLSQGVPTIGLYSNAYYDIKLRGAFAAYGHPLAPLSYPRDLEDRGALAAAVAAAQKWSDADRRLLTDSATALRARWHSAFQTFLQDSHLVP